MWSRAGTFPEPSCRRLPFPACNCDLGEGCHAGGGSAGGNGGGGGSSKGNTAGGEGGGSEGDGEGGGGARGGDGGAALLPRRVLREAGGGAAAARLAREDAWAWEAAEEAVAWGAQRAYEQQDSPPQRRAGWGLALASLLGAFPCRRTRRRAAQRALSLRCRPTTCMDTATCLPCWSRICCVCPPASRVTLSSPGAGTASRQTRCGARAVRTPRTAPSLRMRALTG